MKIADKLTAGDKWLMAGFVCFMLTLSYFAGMDAAMEERDLHTRAGRMKLYCASPGRNDTYCRNIAP